MTADSPQPFAPGAVLGRFTIVRAIGAGGMGEVYEAEDSRLHRHVALKVVRHDAIADPLRRARLEREATAVAKLNHPHIVTVHSLDEHEGLLFITMELIEGATLAEALAAGALPLDRVMSVAIQLADALSAAHALGVVHRDLKPSNIMLARDGVVKVLDFGLSRLGIDPSGSAAGASLDTLTVDGSFMGTAPYISPEQIDGEPADSRSDLFSLGVVMFETATGQRPFTGQTAVATLSAIAKDVAPDASRVNPRVPQELARIIDRCLNKDRSRRVQSALDLRDQLQDLVRLFDARGWTTAGEKSVAPSDRRVRTGSVRRRALTSTAAILAIGAVAAGWMAIGRASASAPRDARVVQFGIDLPKGHVIFPEFNPHIALSPDGTELAVTTFGPVLIRRLDSLETRPLAASESPGFRVAPVFSPDGSTLAFIDGNSSFSPVRPFYSAALSGGAAVKLADYDAFHRGDWSEDGWIYWTDRYPGGIVRIPAHGGEVQHVTELDVAHGERSHRFASLLPGGHSLLYTVGFDGISSYDDARIELWNSQSKARKALITGGMQAVYAPSGHIVYARGGKLLAVPFDAKREEIVGSPFEVVDGVLTSGNTGAAEFALSRRGDLAYVPGPATGGRRTLVWVDRGGHAEPLPLPPGAYLYPHLSPDGRSLAVEIEGPNHDVYVYDFSRSVLTKLSTDGESHDPVWSPDGKRLAFRSWAAGGMTMWMMPADRSAEPTRLDAGTRQSPVSFSPDGRFLTFDQKDPNTSDDAWVLALDGGARPQPVARSRFDEGSAKFSPDGRWIAYASNESGRAEVYVQPFPGPGPKVQISTGGGFDPLWRRSGGELFYRSGNKMMAVSIDTAPRLRVSAPKQLWEANYSDGAPASCGMPGVSSSNYDVTADGQRFLMVRDDDASVAATRVVVVLNWSEALKSRAATH